MSAQIIGAVAVQGVGIICLTAPDVWTSGGLFLTRESSTVSHQASFSFCFNAACAQNRFLDSDDLLLNVFGLK